MRLQVNYEAPVAAIAGSLLGLAAFVLAFMFGIVSNRYDSRKELAREDANAIGTAYLRADFLPELTPILHQATGTYRRSGKQSPRAKLVNFRVAQKATQASTT